MNLPSPFERAAHPYSYPGSGTAWGSRMQIRRGKIGAVRPHFIHRDPAASVHSAYPKTGRMSSGNEGGRDDGSANCKL